MTARRPRPAAADDTGPGVAGEELAVLEGGGWAGRWYWRRDLEASQRAVERMGHPVTVDGPGELRGYAPTDRWIDHPGDDHDRGRVWTWRPERVEQQDLEPQAAAAVPAPRAPGDDLEHDVDEDQADGDQVCGGPVRTGGGGAPMPVAELVAGVLRRARLLVCGSRRPRRPRPPRQQPHRH